MSFSNQTNTLMQVIQFASAHADLIPLTNVGGVTNEPALSLINDAISDLLTSPNDWKFNQVEMPMLVTALNKQDYLFAGASAFTMGSTSTGAALDLATNNAITVAGGVVTVKTLEPHRFVVGDNVFMQGVKLTSGNPDLYNAQSFDNGSQTGWTNGFLLTAVTPKTFSFAAIAGMLSSDVGGAPGITNFGWLASASMVEMNNNSSPQNNRMLQAVKTLPPWSKVGNPEKVCVYKDMGNGILKVRFTYVPGSTIWGALLVYQASAPIKTDLSQNWAPFPDSHSAVYRQAVLTRMYRYINSPRAEVEYTKLQAEIAKAQGYDDNEESEVHLCPEDGSILDGWGY